MIDTTKITKIVCDRCGVSISTEHNRSEPPYPETWQNILLSQTGARLDLCHSCNADLLEFLEAKGATGMRDACINKREVL